MLADPTAISLLPWPRGCGLRAALVAACEMYESLASRLLSRLGGGRYEAARVAQVSTCGYPSVLDSFLYPNSGSAVPVNMRTHTDPGLLTLTTASEVAGLQLLDHATRAWIDVEAACAPSDVIVMGGDALETMSYGRLPAAPHRVRREAAPRFSLVFELRLHTAEPLGQPPRAESREEERPRPKRAKGGAAALVGSVPSVPPSMNVPSVNGMAGVSGVRTGAVATAGATQQCAAEGEDEAASAYVGGFVRARLAAGLSASAILREFSVAPEAWPSDADGLGVDELAALLIAWVQESRESELAAAFDAAEYGW